MGVSVLFFLKKWLEMHAAEKNYKLLVRQGWGDVYLRLRRFLRLGFVIALVAAWCSEL